ncbi:MAG: helix-turn-helix domain-containing protein [Alphaproteobacteria bacterium]|nr:helix-turn-helix domain-containing protein [Alphaproteobacteria bacterium]
MEEIVFPNQIRMYRRLHGMPMQELADHLGISLSAVSKIEKGYRRLNQDQLIQVAELLDCALQDLYVNELNTQSEVVQAWKREQERRNKINQSAGLKTLGAGLRHIRNAQGSTLIEIAEHADMTLSVYHRIEMGQREVSDKEYANIAKALGYTTDQLKQAIEKLEQKGVLEEIIEHNDGRYKVLNNARYVNLINNEEDNTNVPLYGTSGENGNILIDKSNIVKEIKSPLNLRERPGLYAVPLCSRRLGSLLTSRAILFIDKTEVVSAGDIALYYLSDNEAALVSIREGEDGQLYGLRWNPDERISIGNSDFTRVHKVVMISL